MGKGSGKDEGFIERDLRLCFLLACDVRLELVVYMGVYA
jgi:hypothetical protein